TVCRSKPPRSGRWTSSTRQLGATGRYSERNSSAESNVLARQPADSMSSCSDSRTERSSSTTNTVGLPLDMLAIVCERWLDRHHVFLLVTAAHRFPTMRPVTDCPSHFVVAVVDDDHGILTSIEYLLESADYTVRVFSSATALLESGDLPQID